MIMDALKGLVVLSASVLRADAPLALEPVEAIRARFDLPALVGARVEMDGKAEVVFSGIRKKGNPEPVRRDDRFHLGSCTKAMTASLVAMLIEEGKFAWDSKLGELFREIEAMHPEFKRATVEQLSSHRGGVAANTIRVLEGKLWEKISQPGLDPVEGRRMATEMALSMKPEHEPGTRYGYSNLGYVILGRLIEKTTGKTWEQVIRERLFEPLGMKSCGFGAAGTPGASLPDQPWGHYENERGEVVAVEPGPEADNPATLGPAGSVHCAIEDWAKFAAFHLRGARGEASPLLRLESFRKLHESAPGQKYTFGGWIREESPRLGVMLAHEGSNGANYSNIWVLPDRSVAALSLSNTGAQNASDATSELNALLVERQGQE